MNKKNLIFTATYNESDNISQFCEEVLKNASHADLLVIDDNSPDGTGEILGQLKKENSRLEVIHRPRKMGLGSAHRLAFLYGIKNGYKTLVTMDADFSHDPKDIPRLINEAQHADFVAGSRYVQGGTCDYTGFRKYVSKIANVGAKLLLGLSLYEYTTSFRAYGISMLSKIDVNSIRSQGYSFFMEIVFHIHRNGFSSREVPIYFRDRKSGKSKINKIEILNGIFHLVHLFLIKISLAKEKRTKFPNVNVSCELCGSNYLVELFGESGHRKIELDSLKCTSMEHSSKPNVLNCLLCGLSFVPKTEEHNNLQELYSKVVDEEYLKYKPARQKTFLNTYDKISPFLPAKGKLLEIGSYCGFFLELAKERGWEVAGIEPSRWAAEYSKSKLNLDVTQGSINEKLHLFKKEYDLIVLWDVLEHLTEPVDNLKQIHSKLKDGGVLCFSTLDIDNWFPKIMGKRWPWLMDMHLFYFTSNTAEHLLKITGFRVISIQKYCHYVSTRYLFKKISAILPVNLLRNLDFIKPIIPENLLVPFSFGDIKLFICKKA